MFKVAFRLVYRIRGRCSRHPAYNPAKDEQAGIKGDVRSVTDSSRHIGPVSHCVKRSGPSRPRFTLSSPTSRHAEGAGTIAHLCRRRHRG